MEMKFCQSCGMPLTQEILGTNADGTHAGKFLANLQEEINRLRK